MISWVIVVAIVFIGLQAMFFRRYALRKVTYDRKFNVERCFVGDQVELVETIANRKLLPLPWLRIESTIHIGLSFQNQTNLDTSSGTYYQNHKSIFSLMSYTQITRRHVVTCDKRGWYRLRTAAMSAGDMIGGQAASKSLETHADLLVFPKPVSLSDIPFPSHSWMGDLTVRRWIVDDPFLIAGVREYQYGDAMNRVNWKATARSGRLQVNKRDYTADPRLVVCVNVEVSENMWAAVTDPELVELGISYAATIADFALAKGIPCGFGFNGVTLDRPGECVRIAPEGGGEQMNAILETMAKLEIARVLPFEIFLEEDVGMGVSNRDYLLITPFLSDKIRLQIERLQENGNSVEVLLTDNADKQERGEISNAG